MNTPYATASLYVGDLAPDVSEALLFEMFNPVGPVASIRVCRDAVTRRSLGYAYVNFHNLADAERALDTMNYANIKNRPCRIMWSHRDPRVRRTGAGNVFIKNLDKGIDHKALYDTFSAFGNILSCKVMTDEAGQSLGYGFVHYETTEAAEMAISKVNGMLLNDKKVFVGHFVPRTERERTVGEAKFTNIYVKNIPVSVDDGKFRAIFEEVGPIASAVVMKDADGKSRGFGFVNYQNPDDAKRALEAMKEREIDGEKIYCGRAQKKAEREAELRKKFEAMKTERMNKYQGVNLYVKNLDDQIKDENLRAEFAAHGTISSAKVMVDDKGASKGFGFVCYSTPEEATKAVTEMNGRMLGTKPIYVALAQRKDVRRAQLEAQHAQRNGGGVRMPMAAPMPGGMYPGGPVYYGAGGVVRGGQFMYQQGPMRGGAGGRWPRGGPGYQGVPGGFMPQQRLPGQEGPAPGGRGAGGRGGRGAGGRGGPAAMGGAPRGGNRQGGQSVKFQPNVRNREQQGAAAGGMAAAPPAAGHPGALGASEPLNPSVLAAASPEAQKQLLGERLFPLIQRHQPQLAGKITGMLLEMDNGELLNLLESQEDLERKVNEAVAVLQEHAAKEGGH